MRKWKWLSVLGVIIMSGGCATYKSQMVRMEPMEAYQYKQSIKNITVAVDPYDTSSKAKLAFYIDVTQKNIKPILIVIENNTDNELLLIRSEVELKDYSGNIYSPVNSKYVADKFEKSEIAYALFGFGIFSYMSAQQANEKMRSDWYEKELPEERVIPPRRKIYGFVFFETSQHLKGCSVEVKIKDLKTGEKIIFEIPIK